MINSIFIIIIIIIIIIINIIISYKNNTNVVDGDCVYCRTPDIVSTSAQLMVILRQLPPPLPATDSCTFTINACSHQSDAYSLTQTMLLFAAVKF